MKKALAYTLSLALLLSLAACGKSQADQPDNSATTSSLADITTSEADNITEPEPPKTPALETLSDITSTAADMSGLGAKDAQAFFNALEERAKNNLIAYADLKDMDGDGTAELVAVDENGTVNIWQAKNGNAVQVADATFPAGTMDSMVYCTKEGKTYIRVNYDHGRWGILDTETSFITVGGVHEVLSFHSEPDDSGYDNIEEYSRTVDGKTVSITEAQFDQFYAAYNQIGDMFLEGGAQIWIWEGRYDGRHHESYQAVMELLLTKANTTPAAGTYGPYTIRGVTYDGTAYAISFSEAKVERKTIQLRDRDMEGYLSSYQKKTVTLVTIRPDTKVSVSGGYNEGDGQGNLVPVDIGDFDGNDRYTLEAIGVPQYIHNGVGKKSFEWDGTPDFVLLRNALNDEDYYIWVDAVSDTQGGFTDVPANAYYADAVAWAVEKKITSGTTTATFSPDQTCTVAQILSFIWRANGSPEPTAANPFTDIKTSDYYYKAALWAAEKGLVTGNKLNPNAPCTRAMTMEYLWKSTGSPNTSGYSAQTITGVYGGKSCSIQFSGAALEETTVTISRLDWNNSKEGGPLIYDEPVKLSLISVRPKSYVTVEGIDWIGITPYIIKGDKDFDESMGGGADMLFSGIVEDVLEAYTTSVALELNGFKDKNGNPYFLQLGTASTSAGPVDTGFTDIPANAEYAQAVAWAVENGITSGTGNGQFSPDTTCTRGQIMTFLYRAMGK